MADPDPAHKPGDKRSADSKTDEKRPPKIRRFDMKIRVPKPQVTDSGGDVKEDTQEASEDNIGTVRKDRNSLVTTVIGKKKESGIVCDAGLPPDENKTLSGVSQRLEPEASGNQEMKQEISENDKVSEMMSVNKMFQTSMELQQAESGASHKEDKSVSQHRNIVDQLFQDFVTTKMREVDDGAKGLSDNDNSTSSAGPESEKTQVPLSIEEINRLLDAEITSIKSRSVVADLTPEDVVMDANEKRQIGRDSNSICSSQTASAAPTDAGEVLEITPGPSQPSVQTSSGAILLLEPEDNSRETTAGEVKGLCASKTKATKKLGLSIGQEMLARITGNWKNGHILEEGEVASSTDSDAEKAFKADPGAEEETNDSDEVSGTGSLSDSDKGKTEGKDSKAKKKKKHKRKHKKKKKHKTQSKEKEEGDRHTLEGRPSKEEKDDGAKKEAKESRSKDKKKSSRHKSKSPVPFDPWDARCYKTESTRSRSRSPLSSRSRHKDQSKDRTRERSKERSRDNSRDRTHGRSRDGRHEWSKERHKKSRDHSKEQSKKRSRSKEKDKHAADLLVDKDKVGKDLRLKIDKNKLRKIAIARALANMERGQGPAVDLTSVKSGGKSVAELTEFCKRISQKETGMEDNVSSDSEMSEEERTSEGEDGPLHHPFIMRDPSSIPNIVMNIRNAKQLPVLTPQEKQTKAATLRTQFPVSSGTQHRIKESEWVPVTTTSATTATLTKSTTTSAATTAKTTTITTTTIFAVPAVPAVPVMAGMGAGGNGGGVPVVAPKVNTVAVPAEQSVFPPVQTNIDIGSIVSERIQAMRRLQQNPYDVQALTCVHRINEQTNAWAQSKHLPGQFTGMTDVRILTQEELAGPDKRNQAWVKKDQFRKAPPVQGGIGMFLLQKMGWKPGDGLGKDNEGNKEPLMLDVKMDRKGLSTTQDARPTPLLGRGPPPPPGVAAAAVAAGGTAAAAGGGVNVVPRAKDLSGKHPVSALTELCTKRRWGAPAFDLICENGPAHKKTFLFKVRVNGVEYVPSAACGNKKLAKAQAAAVCLQEMGLIPRDFVVQV